MNLRGSGGWSQGPRRRQGVTVGGWGGGARGPGRGRGGGGGGGAARGPPGGGPAGGEAASDTNDNDGNAMVEDSTTADEGGEPC